MKIFASLNFLPVNRWIEKLKWMVSNGNPIKYEIIETFQTVPAAIWKINNIWILLNVFNATIKKTQQGKEEEI